MPAAPFKVILLIILAASPALCQSPEPAPGAEELQLSPGEFGDPLLRQDPFGVDSEQLANGPLTGSVRERSLSPPRPVDGDWIYKVRYRVSRLPWKLIALASVVLVPLSAIATMLALRRRKAQQRLRHRRSAGEAPARSLSDVVASVQYASRAEEGRPLAADLQRLNDGVQSEARAADPGVGTSPAGVQVPIDR